TRCADVTGVQTCALPIYDTQIIFDKGFENESEIYLYDLFKMEMKQLTNDDNPDGVSGIPKILGFSA
ncbi:hypothetical protein JGI2_00331, partial [Candidatus Kryptobacter tengchongensis]